jgi:hypothetical protein
MSPAAGLRHSLKSFPIFRNRSFNILQQRFIFRSVFWRVSAVWLADERSALFFAREPHTFFCAYQVLQIGGHSASARRLMRS